MLTKVIVQRSTLTLIDTINKDGLSTYARQNLQQIQERFPGAEIAEINEFLEFKERSLCTTPEEITEKEFMRMLDVLPPQNWHSGDGCECFELCEHLSGRVTQICARIGNRHFAFNGIANQSLDENLALVRFAFANVCIPEQSPKILSCFAEFDQTAYSQGYDALATEHNPFTPETNPWYSWNRGYNANDEHKTTRP